GLSCFWRLPQAISMYGGGAFLLVYVLAVFILGLPLLSGQLLLARGTQADIAGVLARWTREAPHSRAWVWCGALIVTGATLLLACYTVIGGWSLAYALRAVAGVLPHGDLEQARSQFYALAGDSAKGLGWLLLFVGLVVAAGASGLRAGIAPVTRTPAVFIALLPIPSMAGAVWTSHQFPAGLALFAPDFAALTWAGFFEALYQAFFTLSLGTGVILALGSFLPARAPVVRLALLVLLLDLVATLAVVFVVGVLFQGAAIHFGSGLQGVFVLLPVAVDSYWQLALLYTLIGLIGLAAAIGLFEPLARTLQCRLQVTRLRASLFAGVCVGGISVLCLLSFDALAAWRLWDKNLFAGVLWLVTNVILPAVGLLLCLLLGRVLSLARLQHAWQAPAEGHLGFALWRGALR